MQWNINQPFKNKITQLAVLWKDLEIIILSELKLDKDKYYIISVVFGI